MKTDRYTKGILTVIAAGVLTIACNQATSAPGSVAHAAGKFADVQFSGIPGGVVAVDTRTGDIWGYASSGSLGDQVSYMGRIDELGKPLVKPVPPAKN